jgi:hypothetical protein
MTCAHQRDGQQLEVKPCSRCGTFVCEDCWGAMVPLCSPCAKARTAAEAERDRRFNLGLKWSMGAGFGPVLVSLFFFPLPPLVIATVALIGGLWAGASAGNRLLTSTFYCVPGLVTSFGGLFALGWYADKGRTVSLSEMFIPAAFAAGLSLALWFATRAILERFERDPRELVKRG